MFMTRLVSLQLAGSEGVLCHLLPSNSGVIYQTVFLPPNDVIDKMEAGM